MRSEIYSIQFLRGMAALMVVISHAIRAFTAHTQEFMNGATSMLFHSHWGHHILGAGVDIFFVISGFIMVYVATPYIEKTKPVAGFLLRRILRIYPPYLIASSVLVGYLVLKWLVSGNASYDLSASRLLGSLTLFPTWNEKGAAQPILGVGWTLTYEMYFYAIFALALWLSPRNLLCTMVTLLSAVFLAAHFIPSTSALSHVLQSPIVFEFALGCLIGYIYLNHRNWLPSGIWALPALALFAASAWVMPTDTEDGTLRLLYWGIPAALLVASTLNLNNPKSWMANPFLQLLGNASYSIYLVHIIAIYNVLIPATNLAVTRGGLSLPVDVLILLYVPAAVCAGLIFYYVVEKRLQFKKSLKRW